MSITTFIHCEKKTKKWSMFIRKISSFKENNNKKQETDTINTTTTEPTITNKDEISRLSRVKLALCKTFYKIKAPTKYNHNKKEQQPITTTATLEELDAFEELDAITTPYNNTGILLPSKVSNQQETETIRTQSQTVPLRQFLRYSMNRSDRRNYQRRRITQPFKPIYEIEWQKDQWLQLDNSTNKKIERLRKTGFSKIAIRKDQSLKKHIRYENPLEIDVLLELSLHAKSRERNEIGNEPEPIICHQPSQFAIRRTRWWHASRQIGEANLPNWVDTGACCNGAVMDPTSVLDIITSYSQTFLPLASSNNKSNNSPSISQESLAVTKTDLTSLPPSWCIKSLKYTDPPFLLSKPVLCTV